MSRTALAAGCIGLIKTRIQDVKDCCDIFDAIKANLDIASPSVHLVSFDKLNYVVVIAIDK